MKMMRKNSNHLLIEISNCGGVISLFNIKSPLILNTKILIFPKSIKIPFSGG